MEIKFIYLDNIDYENNKVIRKKVSINNAREYVETLINKMINTSKGREYITKDISYTMDKVNEIINIYLANNEAAVTTKKEEKNSDLKNIYDDSTYSISMKLCQEQGKARDKYKTLSKIQKGSLVQALVENDDELIYLACLIEHAKFIDENDLMYKVGLPSSDKATLKSSLAYYTTDGFIKNIIVTDTKPKIAEYWYDGFMELKEVRSNKANTREAYNTINNVLNMSLSSGYKKDCNTLKSALKVFFVKGGDFDFDDCIEFLLGNYTPVDDKLNLDDLRNKIKTRVEKNPKFDKRFIIDNTDIESKLRNIKYDVTDNIEIKLKVAKTNLDDYLYSTVNDNNEKVLIIRNINEKTYQKFLKMEV